MTTPPSIKAKYGTFQDSMRAPVHRWFTYPAGYSYKLVEEKIAEHKIQPGMRILDPFVGTGTTSVAAKLAGIDSVGVEAHPFVYRVAKTKLHWDFSENTLEKHTGNLLEMIANMKQSQIKQISLSDKPELLLKCYNTNQLKELLAISENIKEMRASAAFKRFAKLALTSTLRLVSTAGTGWPYIAPSKYHEKKVTRDVRKTFGEQLRQMQADLIHVSENQPPKKPETILKLGDSRDLSFLRANSIDLLVTSPPYLNNYDYADRTRLEMYFFGEAESWGEITEKVRDKLVTAATTQVTKRGFEENPLSDDFRQIDKQLDRKLRETIEALGEIKQKKSGKKNYDFVVTAYFNDLLKTMQELARVMKPGSRSVWVLGDSAPYAVHIPTEKYIGQIAQGVGFKKFSLETIRERGGKWANNPQRHTVKLKESILTITK